jgi:hypothetical protein
VTREFGEDAYFEATCRENETSSDVIAKDWSRVALAVARKLKTSTEVDPTARIAMDALFVPDRKSVARAAFGRRARPRWPICLRDSRLLHCCALPRKVVFGETNQPNGERYRGQH